MDTPATGSAAPSRGTSNLTYAILAAVAIVGVIFAFSGSARYPNNWYSLFKAVHVLGAVIWVGGGVSIMIHAIRGQRAYKPEDIVTVAKQAAFMGEKVFAPVGLVTFLMGIAMMINTSWGWGHFWIVVGLIGYALDVHRRHRDPLADGEEDRRVGGEERADASGDDRADRADPAHRALRRRRVDARRARHGHQAVRVIDRVSGAASA